MGTQRMHKYSRLRGTLIVDGCDHTAEGSLQDSGAAHSSPRPSTGNRRSLKKRF
jgi:hypothetical protein